MTTLTIIANFCVAIVSVLHAGFLFLEMFLWDKPFGLRTFGLKQEFATASKSLAANQGLYNGFLAAGLAWGLSLGSAGAAIKLFFLGCVVVAGVFGGITVKREILLFQAIPGAIALALMLLS